jgi:type II secretory pathway component GspD/PulD (secretin)
MKRTEFKSQILYTSLVLPRDKFTEGYYDKFIGVMILLSLLFLLQFIYLQNAQAAEEIKINSTSEIKDGVIPAVKNHAGKYDINSLQLHLKQAQNMQDNIIDLQKDFDVFSEGQKINLTLNEIDLPSVLIIIAQEGGKNIIIDESVFGTISADLKNITLNQAMKTILLSKELEARVDGNTIFVASRPAMAKKGLNRKFVKAFKLNNSNCVEIASILETSVFNKGYQVNDTASESTATAMQAVETDGNTPATMPAAQSTSQSSIIQGKKIKGKVEELVPGENFGNADVLASKIKIQQTRSYTKEIDVSNNDGGAIVIPDTRTNSVLVAGLKEDILLAQNAIMYLDKQLSQVVIEVSLVELTKENTSDLGLSLSGSGSYADMGFNNTTRNALHGLGSDAGQTVFGYNSALNQGRDIYARLNALIQNNKAKLLANPVIVALDNSESLIKITDQVVSKMEVIVTQTSTTYDVTLADVGIVLNILPKIGSDGNITMRIRPSITTPLAEKAVGTFGAYVTPISTREVIIQDVRIKTGDTLAIAGLLKESDLEKIGKLPIMSDIPVFGKLFQNKEFDHTKTELVILITPRIIDDNDV